MDSTFKFIFQHEADDVDKTSISGLYFFEKNCQDGVVNQKGEVIIPAEYADIDVLDNQFFKVRVGSKNYVAGEKIGVFSLTGKKLIEPIYNEIYTATYKGEVYLRANMGQFYTFFDKNGVKLSDSSFTQPYISDSPFRIERHSYSPDTSTVYDRFGKVVETSNVPISGQKIIVKSDSSIFYLIEKGDYSKKRTYRIFDADGNSICHNNQTISGYIRSEELRHGLFAVTENGLEKLITHKNKNILEFDNQVFIQINTHYIVVLKNKKYFFYTHEGKSINENGYDEIGDYYEYDNHYGTKLRYVAVDIPSKTFQGTVYNYHSKKDSIATLKGKNYGFVNKYGIMVLPMIYNSKPDIAQNLLCVSQGFETGSKTSFVLDTLGNTILKTNDDNLEIVEDNPDTKQALFEAKQGDKVKLIDLKGNELIKLKYKSISSYWGNVLFSVRDENGDKIVNLRDEFIANLNYSDLRLYRNYHQTVIYNDKIYILRTKDKTQLINLNGDIVKTFDTRNTRYVPEEGGGNQRLYEKWEDDPKYINRDILEIEKDNQIWYYNLETLKEYRR